MGPKSSEQANIAEMCDVEDETVYDCTEFYLLLRINILTKENFKKVLLTCVFTNYESDKPFNFDVV